MTLPSFCAAVCCVVLAGSVYSPGFAVAGPRPNLAQADTASEDVYWRKVRKWNSITGYRAYLKTFPDGLYAEDAREKITRLEGAKDKGARTTAQPPNPDGAPNKPIPGSLPASHKIIQFIERHPAFADAPPVRLRRLKVTHKFPNDPTNYADETRRYTWLRRGLVRERRYYRSPGSGGGIFVHEFDQAAYLNGLLPVASNSNSNWKGGGYTLRSRTTAIDNVGGRLFPLAAGNRMNFAIVIQSIDNDGSRDTRRHGWDMKVSRRLPASEIDSRLPGIAWEIDMTYRFGAVGGEPDEERKKLFFIETFGLFLRLKNFNYDDPKSYWTLDIDSFSLM